MKLSKLLPLVLCCSLVALTACSDDKDEPKSPEEGSTLNQLEDALWYYNAEEAGLNCEVEIRTSTKTAKEVRTNAATGSRVSYDYNVYETNGQTINLKNTVSNGIIISQFVSANHLKANSYITADASCPVDMYKVKSTITCDIDKQFKAQDLDEASLRDIKILTPLSLAYDESNDVLNTIAGGYAYVLVNGVDPYVIKFDIDGYDKMTDYGFNSYLGRYECILGYSASDIKTIFGSSYKPSQDNSNIWVYDKPAGFSGPMESLEIEFDGNQKAVNIWTKLDKKINLNTIRESFEIIYGFWGYKPNETYSFQYYDKNYSFSKSPFTVGIHFQERIILYSYHQPEYFEIEDFCAYLGKSTKDLITQWGLPIGEEVNSVRYDIMETHFVKGAEFFYNKKKLVNKIYVYLYDIDDVVEFLDKMYGKGEDREFSALWSVNGDYYVTLQKDPKYIIYETRVEPTGDAAWASVGSILFDDIFLAPLHSACAPYSVDVEESVETPGLYRLVNPYGENCPFLTADEHDLSRTYYLEIDATDPDYVWIKRQNTGVNMVKTGNIRIMNRIGYDMESNFSLSLLKKDFPEDFGKKSGNVITFPAKSLLLDISGGNPFEAGIYVVNSNAVTLTLPK